MKTKNKQDLILDSIIQTYLLANTPIGSSELNSSLCIPASTIRVYLKRLSEEGFITQLHISGGRIPTINTMKKYWEKELVLEQSLDINNLDFICTLCEEYELYCLIYGGRAFNLKEIFNLNNKFIVLDFEEEELVLKFENEYFVFLKTLLGLSLFDIENIALKVNFYELSSKISDLKHRLIYHRSNEKRAYQIYQNDEFTKLLEGDFQGHFKNFLEFEPFFKEGFMGLNINANFLDKKVNILFAGSVYTDYKKILQQIKEVA